MICKVRPFCPDSRTRTSRYPIERSNGWMSSATRWSVPVSRMMRSSASVVWSVIPVRMSPEGPRG